MKVIIAGSRDINDISTIAHAFHRVHWNINEVVSGGAHGVDRLGETWAKEMSIPVTLFPADWDTHGKAAGHIRNRQMANYADALIAIWDGKSSGTLNMINTMVLFKKPVYVYCPT